MKWWGRQNYISKLNAGDLPTYTKSLSHLALVLLNMGSSNPREKRRADLSQLKPLSPMPWGGNCRATDNCSLHSTVVVAVSKRFRYQALSWYSEIEKPPFPLTLYPMPSPPARAKCHRYTGMCQHEEKETQRNNTSSDTLCFRAHAAKWEQWRGLQNPVCPRASPMPAYTCCSHTAPKIAPRTRCWWCSGYLTPSTALEMSEQMNHSCSPQVWSLVTPALLPAHHPCARPDTSPPLSWQAAGHCNAACHQHLGAAETVLVSVHTAHTSRNLLAIWYRLFLQLQNLKLQLLVTFGFKGLPDLMSKPFESAELFQVPQKKNF